MAYKVLVSKSNLQFAASHFITMEGKCELIHGHNYAVSLELKGDLTEDGYVFDFVALKRALRETIETLDHRFLLATKNPHLQITEDNESYEILYKQDRYVLPKRAVKALPLENITAELLATYIFAQIRPVFHLENTQQIQTMTIGVEEATGQTAYFTSPIH